MEIRVHPARARPGRTIALLTFVGLATWVLGAFAAPAFHLPVGACAALIGALFGFTLRAWLLPTRYLLDDEGIEVRGLTRRRYAWSRFRGWRKERGGYYMSPFSDPTRFDHFRGLYMFMDGYVIADGDLHARLEEELARRISR